MHIKNFYVLLHHLDTEGLQIAIYALKTYFLKIYAYTPILLDALDLITLQFFVFPTVFCGKLWLK